jgi:hypothetical protein
MRSESYPPAELKNCYQRAELVWADAAWHLGCGQVPYALDLPAGGVAREINGRRAKKDYWCGRPEDLACG